MLLPRLPSGPELTAPVAAGCSLSLQAAMDVTALLNALSSPDASLRQPAEQQVEAAKQSNMVRGAATSPSSHPRRLAGLSVAFAIQGSSTRQLLMQLLLVTSAAHSAQAALRPHLGRRPLAPPLTVALLRPLSLPCPIVRFARSSSYNCAAARLRAVPLLVAAPSPHLLRAAAAYDAHVE